MSATPPPPTTYHTGFQRIFHANSSQCVRCNNVRTGLEACNPTFLFAYYGVLVTPGGSVGLARERRRYNKEHRWIECVRVLACSPPPPLDFIYI